MVLGCVASKRSQGRGRPRHWVQTIWGSHRRGSGVNPRARRGVVTGAPGGSRRTTRGGPGRGPGGAGKARRLHRAESRAAVAMVAARLAGRTTRRWKPAGCALAQATARGGWYSLFNPCRDLGRDPPWDRSAGGARGEGAAVRLARIIHESLISPSPAPSPIEGEGHNS